MPIIQSLLDTDLYKFTMMQAVLHNYPNAEVEWEFRLSLIHISEPTRRTERSRMPSSA